MTKSTGEVWYRAEVHITANWDCDYEYISHYSYQLRFLEYPVLKTTPKCVWLQDGAKEVLVRGKAIRQRATPTRETAVNDEIARRKRHVRGAAARLKIAEDMLKFVEMKK